MTIWWTISLLESIRLVEEAAADWTAGPEAGISSPRMLVTGIVGSGAA
jgi:hypothetical protein